ncbi:Serine/threonine kinase [Borealophlyctis nickersoniae]|nr:Serine/threonine kinase [Borealophlyctis nickersoniae]
MTDHTNGKPLTASWQETGAAFNDSRNGKQESDSKIADLKNKIQIEAKCKEGAENMLRNLKDPDAIQQCQLNILESQRRLEFLSAEMTRLLSKRRSTIAESPSVGYQTFDYAAAGTAVDDFALRPPSSHGAEKRNSDPGTMTAAFNAQMRNESTSGRGSVSTERQGPPSTGRLSMTAAMLGSLLSAFGRSKSGASTPKSGASSASSLNTLSMEGSGRPALTQFDYLKSETPITSDKVKYKLEEVRFKLDVEHKVKAGIDRMRKATETVDPKQRQNVHDKMVETNAKVAILQKAQQRYQGLYVEDDEGLSNEEENRISHSDSMSSLRGIRRLVSGKLHVRLIQSSGLPGKKSHKADAYASIRLDGTQKAKSRSSRGKWGDDFDITVDKGQEVEIVIFEKGGTMLAMVWFKLWELEEEMKMQKAARNPFNREGSSNSLAGESGAGFGPGHSPSSPEEDGVNSPATGRDDGYVQTWLDLEPSGRLQVGLKFTPVKPQKRPMKSAIDQAERMRKEKEVMRSEQAQMQARRARDSAVSRDQAQPPQEYSPPHAQGISAPSSADNLAQEIAAGAGDTSSIASSHQQRHGHTSSAKVPGPVAPKNPRGDSMAIGSGPKGIGLDDFNFIAVLGRGNFGKVMLAEDKYNKQLFAIKVLKKEFIIENDEVESTKSEKRVFVAATRERHPFLVNLHSCFQTESRIYFVMEYVSGGDLMWHIQHQQFSEKRAKFYACEVLLALEYFHKNNIIYRDLKLDNILLTLDGHIKIADYGLCKESMGNGATTNTFCGTPEFMAPEIVSEKPYGRAVDWWAFGVLIYEMLLGQSPFRGEDEDEIFEAILEDEILYPVNMAKDAVSLLQKLVKNMLNHQLLTKDPNKRLGGGRGDADEIKRHPFFKTVDWEAMLQLKLTPPYYPTVSSPTDVSNFDEEFTRELPVLTPCNSVLSAADQEEFRGFTYIAEWAQAARAKAAGK